MIFYYWHFPSGHPFHKFLNRNSENSYSCMSNILENSLKHVFDVALEKLFYLYNRALGHPIEHCLWKTAP